MIGNIKGAIFDMDGTLIDSLCLWDVLWEAFGKRYLGRDGFRPSDDAEKAIRTMTLKDTMEMIHKTYALGESGAALLEAANEVIRDFYARVVQCKPGVREFLEYCKENGIKMCIVSATGPKLLQTAIEHCELGSYFSDVLSCGKIGKGKDQLDIYLAALGHLGTPKEETCVFDDSLVAIETAHKLGLRTVAVYDRYNYGQEEMRAIADAYIADGETLLKLI